METTTHDGDTGRRVDALRADRDITVLDLSNNSQIPLTTLQRRLAGDGRLTVTELRRISSALGVTPASWFPDEVEA